MDKASNQQIIEDMYKNYAAGNMSAVLSCFDKDIIWERPGAPFIPFSGSFKGIEEVTKMFAIQATTLSIKKFVPEKICTNEDTVVVFGDDEVDVVATGKTYSTDWVQSFTLKDGKIICVRVYLDTKAIADAFLT
ncbi:nuclear transport factor 2 family protein [Ginsengibacter hankyongi]|uniref:Nuclear transport factor 2 family protein n=1 Tax=Ginsengibacter hankyongi TaxID=2607284 RepID=A0A5J5ILM6_9BACT|nr:nuclear transport factor 2 family protein [Ginsengibacter hankyongi]KAA9041263.1 nuclear transport factor 2 family protein [Ginsengibacter hankyongi]